MSAVIICRGINGTLYDGRPPADGEYLSEYDPEFGGGLGWSDWTTDPAKAMRFPTTREALDCWRSQSVTRPLRVDGQPNRPLTAYTVEIGELP